MNEEEMPNYRLPKPIYLYESQPSVMGIDLGTTRCSVAVSRNKTIEVVQYVQGDRSFPSIICFDEDPPIIGNLAARRLRNNSKSVVYDNKRIIGKDLIMIEQNPLWPFKLVNDNTTNHVQIEVCTKSGLKRFSSEEIAAILLAEMKKMASDFQADYNRHQPIKKAVITVPSFFNARQREATMKAANMAGIEVMALLDEPVAGALYFMVDKRRFYSESDQKIEHLLVFDLGGGTLDISILENNNGNLKEISTCGDLYLGGRDFDVILVNHFRWILMAKFGMDPMQNEKMSYKLSTMVETIKKDLSAVEETNFDPTEFMNEAEDVITITRKDFEELSSSLLMSIKAKIAEGLYEAKKTANEIDQVVYMGGCSQMAIIKDLLKSMFPQSNHYLGADSELAAATGAMIYALQLLQ